MGVSGLSWALTPSRRPHEEVTPWSEVVSLAEVSRGQVVRVLDAREADRKRIARALGIDQLDQLEAR